MVLSINKNLSRASRYLDGDYTKQLKPHLKMRQFNQSISIEIQVDSIAQQMLSVMNPEFKHAELVVEATIARMMRENSLSYLYNALNGYPATINFAIGDTVVSRAKCYNYKNGTQEYLEIGNATVIQIDEYSDKKLKLQFEVTKKDGTIATDTEWVSHTYCEKIQL